MIEQKYIYNCVTLEENNRSWKSDLQLNEKTLMGSPNTIMKHIAEAGRELISANYVETKFAGMNGAYVEKKHVLWIKFPVEQRETVKVLN